MFSNDGAGFELLVPGQRRERPARIRFPPYVAGRLEGRAQGGDPHPVRHQRASMCRRIRGRPCGRCWITCLAPAGRSRARIVHLEQDRRNPGRGPLGGAAAPEEAAFGLSPGFAAGIFQEVRHSLRKAEGNGRPVLRRLLWSSVFARRFCAVQAGRRCSLRIWIVWPASWAMRSAR